MDALLRWSETHTQELALLAALSALLFLGSLVLLPILVARIPTDYFASHRAPPPPWIARHPQVRFAIRILRNLLGAVLLLAGLAMLVLPGQGILTILAAVVLLDVPGKRALELALMRRAPVRRALNWIRRRAGRADLLPPPPPRTSS